MYDVRSRYLADTVATVGPARLLTMLYDRMALDVDRAATALAASDRAEATTQLAHAQEIVAELISSLDTGAWDGGPGLMSIYTYLLSELIEASMTGSVEKAVACKDIVAPLRDAWHEAADSLAAATVPAQRPAPAQEHAGLGVLGVG